MSPNRNPASTFAALALVSRIGRDYGHLVPALHETL
jgi:hypothetical protein